MIHAVIFDLDGVLVSTDEFHFKAWSKLARELDIRFDRTTNEHLRGVSRMASLEIILEKTSQSYTAEQKRQFAEKKNGYYRDYLQTLRPEDLLPGALDILRSLRDRNIKIAVASASRNAAFIIEKLRLTSRIDVLVDGNHVSKSKPDPAAFLLAADRLCHRPEDCIVVEDAAAGVEAARQANMKVFAIGTPQRHPDVENVANDLSEVTLEALLNTTAP